MSAPTASLEEPGAAGGAGIEAALQKRDTESQDFDSALRAALAATGGALLFQMHFDVDGLHEHVAAIGVGNAENRRFFLVILPAGDGKLKIEPVETSSNPLARIASAYAELIQVFDIAA